MVNYEKLMKCLNSNKQYTFSRLSEESIKRVEENIGYKLPAQYIELLNHINGCTIMEGSDYLTNIIGIDPDGTSYESLEQQYDLFINEWEYPKIGIPIVETFSGGHDMIFLDYSNSSDQENPVVSYVDREQDEIYPAIANDFDEFLQMIIDNKIDEKLSEAVYG